MCKKKFYAKMEKLEAQICKCTRQGLKVIPLGRENQCQNRPTQNPCFLGYFIKYLGEEEGGDC